MLLRNQSLLLQHDHPPLRPHTRSRSTLRGETLISSSPLNNNTMQLRLKERPSNNQNNYNYSNNSSSNNSVHQHSTEIYVPNGKHGMYKSQSTVSTSANNISNWSSLNESQQSTMHKLQQYHTGKHSPKLQLKNSNRQSTPLMTAQLSPPPPPPLTASKETSTSQPILLDSMLTRNLKRKAQSLHVVAKNQQQQQQQQQQQEQRLLQQDELTATSKTPVIDITSPRWLSQDQLPPREQLAAELSARRRTIIRQPSLTLTPSPSPAILINQHIPSSSKPVCQHHKHRNSIHAGDSQLLLSRPRQASTLSSSSSSNHMNDKRTTPSPSKSPRKYTTAIHQEENKKIAAILKKRQQMLPIDLHGILEKPFKATAIALRYGLEHSDPEPNIQMSEYQIFTVFRRLVERYPIAMKKREEWNQNAYGLKMPTVSEMKSTVSKKVKEVAEILRQIHDIKDSSASNGQRAQRVLFKFFEGITYLKFLFFDVASLTDAANSSAGQKANKRDDHNNSNSNDAESASMVLIKSPDKCFPRLMHSNFKGFFHDDDFNVLLEYLVLPDCQLVFDRATTFLHKYYGKQLSAINEHVNHTMNSFFNKEQSILFIKKQPQHLQQIFELQPPSFNTPNTTQTARVAVARQSLSSRAQERRSSAGRTNNNNNSSRGASKLTAFPEQALAKIVDSYASDLQQTVKRFAIKSPYHEDVDAFLKASIVKMYQQQSHNIHPSFK